MADSLQVTRLNEFHDQLARWMVINPTATLIETAEHFKVTPGWISIVKNSDAFKVHYKSVANSAFASAIDEIYGQTIELTTHALNHLNKKVAKNGAALSEAELLHIADTGLKRLGYGASKSSPGLNVQINNNGGGSNTTVVSSGDLAAARRKMAEVHGVSISDHRAPEAPAVPRVLEVEAVEIK